MTNHSAQTKTMPDTFTTFITMPALQHELALWHQHMSGIAATAVQTNLRAAKGLLRLADPTHVFALQQQIATAACNVVLTQTEAVRQMAKMAAPPRLEYGAEGMRRGVPAVGLMTDHDVAVRLAEEARPDQAATGMIEQPAISLPVPTARRVTEPVQP